MVEFMLKNILYSMNTSSGLFSFKDLAVAL